MTLVRYSTAGAIREDYVKEPGSTAFVLIVPRAAGHFLVRGAEMHPMTLTLLRSDIEYEVVSPARGETLEIYLRDDELIDTGLGRWLDPETMNLRPAPVMARRLLAAVSPLVDPARRLTATPNAVRRGVLDVLAAALDSVDRSVPPVATVRLHRLYRQAIAVIDEEPDLMLTVVELARRLGVTTRTLRYAFGHALGISPYQYLLRRRLTIVRAALLDPGQADRSALHLLMDLGISHQSEFAHQYRRLFGELPSQTRTRGVERAGVRRRLSSWPRIEGRSPTDATDAFVGVRAGTS